MKLNKLVLNFFILIFVSKIIFAQADYAINFQNYTYQSHGDFIYCGQPNYNFTNQLTVACWIKWTTNPGQWLVSNHQERENEYSTYIAYATHNTYGVTSEAGQFWLRNNKNGNKIEFTVQNSSGTKATATSTTNPQPNVWYFLAGTYDGSYVRLYVNGSLQGSAPLTGNIRSNTDCRLNFGRLPWGYGFFVGYMDEVRIWNSALSATDIQNQMNSSSTISSSTLVSRWNFNEGTGTTINDEKGVANGTFFSALIDIHGSSVDFPSRIIEDADRSFVTGAWNGKNLVTVAGAGVDETNVIVNNNGNVFTLQYGFGGTAPNNRTTPVLDFNTNMTWMGVIDPSETSQWITSETPWPVELSSISAKLIDKRVILNWKTETEVNNYGFEVERKLNTNSENSHWEKIGFVQGNGNSNSAKIYSFIDDNPPIGKISYRLKQIDNDGCFKYSDLIEVLINNPGKTELFQNYPNPFNPSTAIRFSLGKTSNVKITIYDILGNIIRELINENRTEGEHIVFWNGTDKYNKNVSSGIYYYSLETEDFSQIQKMILIR